MSFLSSVLNLESTYAQRFLIFEVGQTRVCTRVCSVVAANDNFEISLTRATDLNPRVQLAPGGAIASVNDTVGHDGNMVDYCCDRAKI